MRSRAARPARRERRARRPHRRPHPVKRRQHRRRRQPGRGPLRRHDRGHRGLNRRGVRSRARLRVTVGRASGQCPSHAAADRGRGKAEVELRLGLWANAFRGSTTWARSSVQPFGASDRDPSPGSQDPDVPRPECPASPDRETPLVARRRSRTPRRCPGHLAWCCLYACRSAGVAGHAVISRVRRPRRVWITTRSRPRTVEPMVAYRSSSVEWSSSNTVSA